MNESSISTALGGTAATSRTTSEAAADHSPKSWLLPLLTRLHFYIGLFIGPFLLIAALSGIVYALTPQIEDHLYRKALYTDSLGPAVPLQEQIAAARGRIGDDMQLVAVRPAPMPGTTTRVMFSSSALGPSESHAVFVDPVSGDVRDTLDVYGAAGVLPVRSWLDRFHRGLLLGDIGRLYSELAASWLWLLAVGGLVLWFSRRRRERTRPSSSASTTAIVAPSSAMPRGVAAGPGATLGQHRRQRLRRWHGTLGAWAFLGVVFFSITGLTWSNHAGGNIGVLRAHYGWGTPSVATTLPAQAAGTDAAQGHLHGQGAHSGAADGDEHAEHRALTVPVQKAPGTTAPAAEAAAGPATVPLMTDDAMFDAVLQTARAAGIDAGKVEIRPARGPDKAWTVTEVDRAWPTQVDAVSIDPRDMSILDRTDFQAFPLAAKLTRWGIDLHMGTLFGLPNQLLLIVMASCLSVMVIWGYMMWWRRRPTRNLGGLPRQGVLSLAGKAPWPARLLLVAVAVALGVFLPVMGVSLVFFLLWDALLQWRARRPLSERGHQYTV